MQALEVELSRRDFPLIDEEALIREKLARLGSDPPVHMLGHLQNLDALYQTLDLLAVPSLNEPFGRVVIESMAKGVPCVAAEAGGIPEIITDGSTGLLFPPTDTAALAERIAECVRDPGRLNTLRAHALREVRDRFNIEAQIRRLDALYQELLAANALADGILPKLENAYAAIQAGVNEVLIGEAGDLKKNTGPETADGQLAKARSARRCTSASPTAPSGRCSIP